MDSQHPASRRYCGHLSVVFGERRLSRQPEPDERSALVASALNRRQEAEAHCGPFHRLQKLSRAALEALGEGGPCVLLLGDSLSRGPAPTADGPCLFDHPDLAFNALAVAGQSKVRAFAPGQVLDEVALGLVRRLRAEDVLVVQDAGPHHDVATPAGLAVERFAAAAPTGVRLIAITAPADAHTPDAFNWTRPIEDGLSANDAVREGARRSGAAVLDLEMLRPDWDDMLTPMALSTLCSDGVHFTRAGNSLFAAALAGAATMMSEAAAHALSAAAGAESASRFTSLVASAMRAGRAAAPCEREARSTASRGI